MANEGVVELVTFRAAQGMGGEEVARALAVTQGFLSAQPGFVAREVLARADGAYLDLVRWRSRADADRAMQAFLDHPECLAAFAGVVVESSVETAYASPVALDAGAR